ncbi:hypothetical protein Leryth_024204 [Lithospermum erythrorhizon]|nr:hypothetical protein Leryth_024204 [Lithospermum erythrorhizon]
MKVKKQNVIAELEPFKVLCDGTFVHHLLVNKIVPADTAIANILGAQVKLFTTRCDHEQRKSAVNCLTEVIGEKNDEHFYVATQDAELRRKFHEFLNLTHPRISWPQIPGVPLIYALRNSLFMEKPSTMQHQFAKVFEEGRSHMTEQEYKLLKMKKAATAEGESISSDANVISEDDRTRLICSGVKVQTLSCLPKKMHAKKDNASEKGAVVLIKPGKQEQKKEEMKMCSRANELSGLLSLMSEQDIQDFEIPGPDHYSPEPASR